MILGTVNPDGKAIVPLRVRGPQGASDEVQTLVDTGFDAWLTLPPSTVEALGLVFTEETHYTLADGSRAISRLFAAQVEWFGRWRRVLVVEMESEPVLGMTMLRGSHLGIDVIDGGRVEIRPLGS